MKIGIMTHWWAHDNYGQMLQCYALQKYLRDAGHDAYLIRYDAWRDHLVPKPLWRKLLKACNPVALYEYIMRQKRETANTNRRFDDFRAKYIKHTERIYNHHTELKEEPPEADVYIVGSDQVWNPAYLPTELQVRAYFLDFGTQSIKRFSYAASFGKEKLDDEFINLITPFLKKFDYVSVREKTGLALCKQCGIDNAEWVPDPTLLLDADTYRTLYKDESITKIDKPYVFLYYLDNHCDFPVKSVYDWTKNKNLDVVYVSGNTQSDKYKKLYPTIPDWINLLENAEYVITNSYHCAIFSFIFGKNLGVIPLSQKHKGMNSRIESLFEMLNTEERTLSADFSVFDKKIDRQIVSDRLQKLRFKCKLTEIIKNV